MQSSLTHRSSQQIGIRREKSEAEVLQPADGSFRPAPGCLSPGPPGGRRERRGTWDWEELVLPLPVLTRTGWGAALTHCVAVTYCGQGHWATWSLGREGGRAGFRSLLPSCTGSQVMEAREEVSKAGSGARAGQNRSSLWGP